MKERNELSTTGRPLIVIIRQLDGYMTDPSVARFLPMFETNGSINGVMRRLMQKAEDIGGARDCLDLMIISFQGMYVEQIGPMAIQAYEDLRSIPDMFRVLYGKLWCQKKGVKSLSHKTLPLSVRYASPLERDGHCLQPEDCIQDSMRTYLSLHADCPSIAMVHLLDDVTLPVYKADLQGYAASLATEMRTVRFYPCHVAHYPPPVPVLYPMDESELPEGLVGEFIRHAPCLGDSHMSVMHDHSADYMNSTELVLPETGSALCTGHHLLWDSLTHVLYVSLAPLIPVASAVGAEVFIVGEEVADIRQRQGKEKHP